MRASSGAAPVAAAADAAPITVQGCDTMARLFRWRCEVSADAVAHREKHFGLWRAFSWRDYWDHASWLGLGLLELGLRRGEVVLILAEDRKEWLYADYGVLGAGGVPCGVYPTDSASQLAYLVEDSGARFLFVEDDEQLDKFLAARDRMPGLEHVIVVEREGLRGFADPQVQFLDDLYARGRAARERDPGRFTAELEAAGPDDLRMVVYTSGTTGPPKGAMLSHRNVLYQLTAGLDRLDLRAGDELLCFLPLCHILERLVSAEMPLASGHRVNFAESPETVFENLREVAPHGFTAVPRFWEKIYSRLMIQRSEATRIGRFAFDRALAVGARVATLRAAGRAVPAWLALRHAFWDFFVLANVRRMVGMGRARRGTSGGAPISPELLRWFAALGVPIYEGYGQTESTGVISVNHRLDSQIGTVGPLLPGSEARIVEEGELLVRGPHVFAGYWRKPAQTDEVLDSEGWLHTGDTGRLDEAGRVTITGRLKDIIITAGGKNITPVEIESRLKFSPYVADAVVIGDRRRYLTCLVMVDQENVEQYAQRHRIPFSDFASLCAAREVQDLIGAEIAAVNRAFAQVEQIKAFRLLDMLLTPEDEELTPTMKLKRGLVEQKHRALVDSMY